MFLPFYESHSQILVLGAVSCSLFSAGGVAYIIFPLLVGDEWYIVMTTLHRDNLILTIHTISPLTGVAEMEPPQRSLLIKCFNCCTTLGGPHA